MKKIIANLILLAVAVCSYAQQPFEEYYNDVGNQSNMACLAICGERKCENGEILCGALSWIFFNHSSYNRKTIDNPAVIFSFLREG